LRAHSSQRGKAAELLNYVVSDNYVVGLRFVHRSGAFFIAPACEHAES
jgi:hypothetical protein